MAVDTVCARIFGLGVWVIRVELYFTFFGFDALISLEHVHIYMVQLFCWVRWTPCFFSFLYVTPLQPATLYHSILTLAPLIPHPAAFAS